MFGLLLSSMMLPGVVTLVPFFVIFDRLGWINTFLPLVVPRFLAHNPFYIFLMRQFFRGIPRDLFDAARMDGWNDFLHPLVYLGGNRDLWTLALGLNALKGLEGETTVHLQMAYSVLMIFPIISIFAVGQRYFVEGITFTGLKG
jgi:ABC-type glycerol-3-phosphate transport system permease component